MLRLKSLSIFFELVISSSPKIGEVPKGGRSMKIE